MSRLFDFAADIFLPNRCPCCGRFIKWNERLCTACEDGLPLYDASGERPPENCSAAVSLFAFNGPAQQGIYSMKDGHGRGFAAYSAELLAEKLKGCGAEIITCVPLSRRRKAERGWDQAQIIALELSKAMNVPCDFSLLARRNPKKEQHDLHADERRQAAMQQYHTANRPGNIEGKHIIITDDVLTTGATLSRCAGLLHTLGAAEVIAVTLCRTELKSKRERCR